MLQPTRMSFLGHDSREARGEHGTGTRGVVQPTGIALEKQSRHRRPVWEPSALTVELVPWKSNLWAGFLSRENTLASCRRTQETVTSRDMDNKPASELFS